MPPSTPYKAIHPVCPAAFTYTDVVYSPVDGRVYTSSIPLAPPLEPGIIFVAVVVPSGASPASLINIALLIKL